MLFSENPSAASVIGVGRNEPSNSCPKSTKLRLAKGSRWCRWQRSVHGGTPLGGDLDFCTMKKLLVLVVLVALAAVAAKKVRTV